MNIENTLGDVEETIIFDIELEVRRRNGEIDNWKQIHQQIERDYMEYVTEGDRDGW